MPTEDESIIVDLFERLSTNDAQGTPDGSPEISAHDVPTMESTELGTTRRPLLPRWSGRTEEFDDFAVQLRVILSDPTLKAALGTDQSACAQIFATLPPNGVSRLRPWFKSRLTSATWNINELLDELDRCFQDKDAKERASRRVYAVRQGEAQPFAKFLHVFDTYCSSAEDLAPAGAAQISALRRSLAPYLRYAIALQPDLSATNYNGFVAKVQGLATGLEALPDFQRSTGLREEWYDASASADIPAGRSTQPISQKTPGNVDKDGDTAMGGVNAMNTTDLVTALTTAVVAAMGGRSSPGRNNGQPSGHVTDHRPRAPWVSQEMRDQRVANRQCARCGQSPSHRHGLCKYKGFPANKPEAIVNNLEHQGKV